MPRTAGGATIVGLGIDARTGVPLHRQLYDGVRAAILRHELRPGRRLPSTRSLATDLGISRNTVLGAFGQLLAEGYLERKPGSGTYVTRALPADAPCSFGPPAAWPPAAGHVARPSRRVTKMAGALRPPGGPPRAFRTGPALDLFPIDVWARLAARRWRRARVADLDYGDTAGYRPLRQAVATYLAEARGVHCDADQVLIVNGAQQALSLAAGVLADPGDLVWVEDPGYQGAHAAFGAAGLRLAPVPLDEEGLDLRAATAHGAPRLVYVTPSHQYPLGMTMSLARRLELVEYASRHGCWILEDDYDSEYRYTSRPIASMRGLDGEGRIVYVGTFSKVVAPAVRLGYLVVPPAMVDAFARARWIVDRHSATLEQAVVADFVGGGYFERHIRRMRAVYAERRHALLEAARRYLAGILEVPPRDAGLHLVGWLATSDDDVHAAARAAAAGIEVTPLSPMVAAASVRPALLLGYAAHAPEAIRRGAHDLASALAPPRARAR